MVDAMQCDQFSDASDALDLRIFGRLELN